MATLGWIGMGDMGAPMALRLQRAGHELHVWGRNPARLAPALTRGAIAAGSPAELAARCEAIFVCVTDTAAVESVVFGPGGVVEGAVAGRLLVDHSTIHPERTREMAARLEQECGMAWVDAPVSGGAVGARAGTLVVLAGGAPDAVERARPWLAAYGKHITHLGPSGSGQAGKSCNQAIFGVTIAAWAEVLAYARAVGLDGDRLVAALEGSWADSPVRRYVVPHLGRGHALARGNELLQKDLRIVAEMAEGAGASVPIVDAVRAALGDS